MTLFRSRALTLTATVLPALGVTSLASEPEILSDLAPGNESLIVRGAQGNQTFVESPPGGTFLAIDPVRQSATKLLPRGIDGNVFTLDAQTVLFSYNDNRHGNELWRSDGTREGTYLVKYLVEGTQSYRPEQFVHWRGHVYFINQSWGNATPPQLWRTDGTPGGTQFILDLPTMFNAEDQTVKWGRVSALAASPDALVFIVNISSHSSGQFETLWRSDGTLAGTYRMSNVNDGTPVFASRFLVTNAGLNFFADNHSDEKDHLYFIACKDIDDPLQVWRVDCKGTQAEVVTPWFEIAAWEAQDVEFYVHADRLLLSVMDRVGTNGGIFELKKTGKKIERHRHTTMPAKSLSVSGGKLYFAGLDDQYGEEPRVMPLPQKP